MTVSERLLQIAEQMMSRRGYAGTSVNDIASEAGVGPPTLYWYFKNKQGIVTAVMQRGAERWLKSLPSWDDVSGDSPRQQFIRAVSIGGSAVVADSQFLRLLILLSLERGEHDEAVIDAVRAIRSKARMWMRELMHRAWPQLAARDAEAYAFRMMAYADGWTLRQVIEPRHATERDYLWITERVADEICAQMKRQEAESAAAHPTSSPSTIRKRGARR